MANKTVCILANNDELASAFVSRGFIRELTLGHQDIIVFNGYHTVSPFLYGEKAIEDTGPFDIGRDKKEIKIFKSLPINTIKVGVNRGALLLNILCGGRSVQDVDHHGSGRHKCYVAEDKTTFLVSSEHNQLMIPTDNAMLFAYARISSVKKYEKMVSVLSSKAHKDPELVVYPEYNTICCQYSLTKKKDKDGKEATDFFFSIIEDYF